MTSTVSDVSPRQAAGIAGFGLLILTVLAVFAEFFVRQRLVVPGDAATTASNIMANELLFRFGVGSYLVVAILDVVVAWALYVFLKPVNNSLSLLAAWFRVVYAAIFAIALGNLSTVVQLLDGADYLRVFGTDQLHAQTMVSLDAFASGWDIGLGVFGLHLLVLGYLVFKSGYVPKVLGVLLIIASLGYVADTAGKLLLPDSEISIAMFTFVGELLLMVWLLFRGRYTTRGEMARSYGPV